MNRKLGALYVIAAAVLLTTPIARAESECVLPAMTYVMLKTIDADCPRHDLTPTGRWFLSMANAEVIKYGDIKRCVDEGRAEMVKSLRTKKIAAAAAAEDVVNFQRLLCDQTEIYLNTAARVANKKAYVSHAP